MARPASIPSGGIAAVLVFAAASWMALPGPAAAAARGGQILSRHALSSAAADLDGDGEREVVAVVAEPEEGSLLRVAVWGVRGGQWVSLGEEGIERWIARDGATKVARLGEETAALLPIRDGDRTRVVLAVAAPYESERPGACCLSFSDVRLSAGDSVRVQLVPDDLGSVDSMTPFDLDADGRDELLVTSYAGEGADLFTPTYSLLRQAGDGFAAEPIPLPDGEEIWFSGVGETDAVPGDDLLFVTADNRAVMRVSADGADLALERASPSHLINPTQGWWVAGVADGVLVIVADEGTSTARWPRGGELEEIATLSADTWPSSYLAGEGPDARLVEVSGWDDPENQALRLRVLDLQLQVELELDASPAVIEFLELTRNQPAIGDTQFPNFYPQMGLVPGGLADGRPAFFGMGSLVALDPDGAHTVQPAASLVGGELLGLVGPESEWMAMGSSWYGTGAWAYLGYVGFEPGQLAEARLVVAPLDAIVGTAAEEPADIALENATLVDLPEGPMLYAAENGFGAIVSGERGSLVVSAVGRVVNTDEIEGESLTIALDPPGRANTIQQLDASIVVISPAGIANVSSWDVTVLLDAPELSAGTSFELFEARASVFGEVSAATTVTVDGRPVDSFGDGAFRTDVDALPWPRDVVVVARDPIGHETVRHVEAVGFVDVRALPWIPIMAVLTVAAGVALFLRTPVVRPERPILVDGDAYLEEIDGDLG